MKHNLSCRNIVFVGRIWFLSAIKWVLQLMTKSMLGAVLNVSFASPHLSALFSQFFTIKKIERLLLRANNFYPEIHPFPFTLQSNDLQNRSINLFENSIRVTLPSRKTRILVKMDHVKVKRIVLDRDSHGFKWREINFVCHPLFV